MLEPAPVTPPSSADENTAQLKRLGDELRELRWQMKEDGKKRVTASTIGSGIWIGWVMICLTIVILWMLGGLAVIISALAAANAAKGS